MKMFAFWKYDLFPYVLGGEVEKMDERGCVETKNYGPGRWFTPIKLLPVEPGRALLAKLEALEAEHDEALTALNNDFTVRARVVFGKELGP